MPCMIVLWDLRPVDRAVPTLIKDTVLSQGEKKHLAHYRAEAKKAFRAWVQAGRPS